MRSIAVIALLCSLVLLAHGLPVAENQQENAQETAAAKARGAREAPAAAAPASGASSADEEDEDDDDDEELGLDAIDDDDDEDDEDDEEEDEDDDEGDEYDLDRLLDDLIGGDDEDDDDDDEEPAAASAGQAVAASANQPAVPPAVESDLAEAQSAGVTALPQDSSESASNSAQADYAEDYHVYDQAQAAQPEQHSTSQDALGTYVKDDERDEFASAAGVADAVADQSASQNQPAQNAQAEDSNDDDEDDDEFGLDIGEDDEDDEEESEDDEDEDDDEDDDFTGELTARQARAMGSPPSPDVSAMYVAKYNKFVDTILARINKILKDKYDPVTVRLASSAATNSTAKITNKTKKTTKRKTTKITSVTRSSQQTNQTQPDSTKKSEVIAAADPAQAAIVELSNKLITGNEVPVNASHRTRDSRKKKKTTTRRRRPAKPTANKKVASTTTAKPKPVRAPVKVNVKPQNAASALKKPKSRARATLFGLSSLKRSGDVSVNLMSDLTIIKTRFNLGPLMLKVEKEFGRQTRKEIRSATATTAEMSGRMSLRVYPGGAATLHSIKVLQPKQMRIESPDDHDRTREFVWKRSSNIAHLVSQKLSAAMRSMLRPATDFGPIPVPELPAETKKTA